MSGPASWFGSRSLSLLEQLGRLREQAGGLTRDRAGPAVAETAAAAASPFRRAATLLLPVVSEYSGLMAERVHGLRARTVDARQTFPLQRAAKRPWTAVLRPVVIAGIVTAAGIAVYSLSRTQRARRRS